jgi:hypothetical protein
LLQRSKQTPGIPSMWWILWLDARSTFKALHVISFSKWNFLCCTFWVNAGCGLTQVLSC